MDSRISVFLWILRNLRTPLFNRTPPMAASEFPIEYSFDWWNSYREIAEPNYSDYIDRTSYFSINVQAVCNNKSCFQDVVLKCPGSIHDAQIFLNSSINGMLQKRAIPPFEKILVEGRDPAPIFLLGDPAYPFLPFWLKEFSWGRGSKREKFFSYKLQSVRNATENSFGRFKAWLRC